MNNNYNELLKLILLLLITNIFVGVHCKRDYLKHARSELRFFSPSSHDELLVFGCKSFHRAPTRRCSSVFLATGSCNGVTMLREFNRKSRCSVGHGEGGIYSMRMHVNCVLSRWNVALQLLSGEEYFIGGTVHDVAALCTCQTSTIFKYCKFVSCINSWSS